jgi:DNA (cytosine-5)-methyltransferase 1
LTAYYNEFDKGAAAWLRELIRRDLIAPGDVDERSIEDVRPDELRGYTQHHFFAGIGGWSYALRLAGWPDDRPVWTGSCPCQPFSSAGKGAGFDDQRHLWPAFFHLIRECRPASVFGEQVASKAADAWIDLVQADMEGMGYAFGSVPFPSAGIGAPHIRDRNYWLAYADNSGRERGGASEACDGRNAARVELERLCDVKWLADPKFVGVRGEGLGATGSAAGRVQGTHGKRERVWADAGAGGAVVGGMADMQCLGHQAIQRSGDYGLAGGAHGERAWAGLEPGCSVGGASPLHGFWRDADWLLCRDGKWRPVEPGTFPLAHGLPARVVRLRGYGNAINPHQAAEFIRASGLIEQRKEAAA